MRFNWIFLAVNFATLASCLPVSPPNEPVVVRHMRGSSSDTSSNKNPNATNPDRPLGPPIIWLAGGWNSCTSHSSSEASNPLAMNAFQKFKPMFERLKTQQFPNLEFYASCLTQDILKARVVHSEELSRIVDVDRDRTIDLVSKRSAAQNSPIIIIGHSFGGWMAMRAPLVKIEQPIPILITMDPISAVTCNIAVLEKIINWDVTKPPPANSQGCTTSPSDITAAQRQIIRANVSRWVNIWQLDSLNFLHSTEINEAENIRIYQDSAPSLNGHISLGLNPEVWLKIESYIIASLQDMHNQRAQN